MSFGVLFLFMVMALTTSAAGEERVSASWYGNELRGNKTASGELFNPNGRTVAHRTPAIWYMSCRRQPA
jgi:rare lipoprotein A (peptidoglycan hydrolase)